MDRRDYFKIVSHIIVFYILLGAFRESSQRTIKKLDLYEGDVCHERNGSEPNYECRRAENCESIEGNFKNKNYPDICMFDGPQPIFCCLPNITQTATLKRLSVAKEKCRQYKKLREERRKQTPNYGYYMSGGIQTMPREFTHMALLGFGESIDQVLWGCGGSLVNERWILSAAHCQQMGELMVNWVRLGDLNIVSTTDDARPVDYRIVERVIHPDYTNTSHYNDIALFRLEKDVKFTKYVWPICLNSNPSVDPSTQLTATGWGRTSADGPTSDHLLKVYLHIFSAEQCNTSYFPINKKKLQYGITPDSLICASPSFSGGDTCAGDSGGPLQIEKNDINDIIMYTQIGITSFGKIFCGDNTPSVYTRVSKYIPWIEGIVWPVNLT